jgi:hypothetical protein
MQKQFLIFLLLLIPFSNFAQNKMKTVDELINKTESGWVSVKKWIGLAKNKVEVLDYDTAKAKDALYKTQVTTHSPMGAIVYSTGGILVDNGWIRILGSGHSKLNRSLPEWNKGKSFNTFGESPSFYLVADDIIGGFFAINGGAFGKELGKVFYLSPDDLKWENLDMTYTEFLLFCFNGDLNKFYKNLRWKGWEEEILRLDGNSVFSFFPFLWTKEGKNINKVSRKIVPIEEQYILTMDLLKQTGK